MALRTIAEAIECLTLQKANLPVYQAQVGATAADITRVNEHLAILSSLVDQCELCDANKKTAFGIKDQVLRGAVGEPVAPVPTTPAYVPPFPLLSGILHITNSANRRFEEGPAYDEEIGIALGIIRPSPSAPTPGTVKPTLETFPAQSGNMFAFIIGNRGQSDMWKLSTSPVAVTNWTLAETGTGKAGENVATPPTPGQPTQLQARIQLFKNNQPYGLLSDIVLVTVNP